MGRAELNVITPASVRADLAGVAWFIIACSPPIKIHVLLPAVRMRVSD